MSSIHCYSQRLLNPFNGTMQIISVEHGDAETSDGVHWALYVNHEDIVSHTGMFEVRYGSWSEKQGLKLSIVRGTAQNSIIETVGEQLVKALEDNIDKLPFPPADFHECWLMTDDNKPLVLVESVLNESDRQVVQSPVWNPGKSAIDTFSSEHGDARHLANMVNRRAGSHSKTLWVYRAPNADVIAESGETLDASQFPALLINESWENKNEQLLLQDFLRWQAPWLLQLNTLDDALRQRYESYAWQRQLLCQQQFPLFYKVLDKQALKVARVQARLMGAHHDGHAIKEAFIDTGDKESYSP